MYPTAQQPRASKTANQASRHEQIILKRAYAIQFDLKCAKIFELKNKFLDMLSHLMNIYCEVEQYFDMDENCFKSCSLYYYFKA